MAETFKDPVCDMDVTPETAAGTSEYNGTTYYFCSPGCKRSFDKDPGKYLGKDEQTHQEQPLSAKMAHPQIRMGQIFEWSGRCSQKSKLLAEV